MKNFILIPDSFKGTMSSNEICNIMKSEIEKQFINANIKSVPIADGGEGTVEAILEAVGGEKIYLKVKGPYFENITSFYGILPDKTAVIEMAAAAGLPLVKNKLQAEKTTTYGVGELIVDAINRGCKKILLGLGGSATNDGGCGMAAALGVIFKDKNGENFIPVGESLSKIDSIDNTLFVKKYNDVDFFAMCDINNPLCGKQGAAYVFAPQKGADKNMVEFLDRGLAHLAIIINRDLKKDIMNLPGGGAAGGMGAGMVGFMNAKLESGINFILKLVDFEKLVQTADYIFTGEGKIDSQSLRGKTIMGIANYTKKYNIPLIAVVGCIGDNIDEAYNIGVSSIFSINTQAMAFSESARYSKTNLSITMNNILRLIKMNK